MNHEQLGMFLNGLHLSPSDHPHEEEPVNQTHCLSAEDMITFFPNSQTLSKQQFGELLPVVVYELKTDACHHEHPKSVRSRSLDWKAIVGSVISNVVISISGLIVVAVIPLMPRQLFNVTSQFLIALSVGSLIGDTFLHLIPHALAPAHDHSHSEDKSDNMEAHDHREMVTKSLVALLGVYAFFLTERLTILCQNKTSRRKMKRQRINTTDHSEDKEFPYLPPSGIDRNGPLRTDADKQDSLSVYQSTGLRSSDQKTKSSVVGTENPALTVCAAPSSRAEKDLCSRPPERPMDNTRCVDHLSGDVFIRATSANQNGVGAQQKEQNDCPVRCWPSAVYIHPTDNNLPEQAENDPGDSNLKSNPHQLHNGMARTVSHDSLDMDNFTNKMDWKQTAVNTDVNLFKPSAYADDEDSQPTHPHRDKPHGHHHGHSHDLSSVRAIAYTVIVGDGLHNFCDGIAIGAAFAADIRGGLSTAIAVLCHELPHELGDFAVLLHAGMSVKAAVFYNLLSSILCAAGTVIGLLLGRIASVDAWIFMLTAGMFVYIALVDMMPELATNRLKGQRFCHQPSTLFLWQNTGILIGYGIMLLIALYENQLT